MYKKIKNRYKTDNIFRLIYKTRCRIYQSLNKKSKSISTKKFLGIDVNTYRKWMEFQMTPDMKWKNFDIVHVRCFSTFDISDDDQLKEGFNWKSTQTLLKKVHQQKTG